MGDSSPFRSAFGHDVNHKRCFLFHPLNRIFKKVKEDLYLAPASGDCAGKLKSKVNDVHDGTRVAERAIHHLDAGGCF